MFKVVSERLIVNSWKAQQSLESTISIIKLLTKRRIDKNQNFTTKFRDPQRIDTVCLVLWYLNTETLLYNRRFSRPIKWESLCHILMLPKLCSNCDVPQFLHYLGPYPNWRTPIGCMYILPKNWTFFFLFPYRWEWSSISPLVFGFTGEPRPSLTLN